MTLTSTLWGNLRLYTVCLCGLSIKRTKTQMSGGRYSLQFACEITYMYVAIVDDTFHNSLQRVNFNGSPSPHLFPHPMFKSKPTTPISPPIIQTALSKVVFSVCLFFLLLPVCHSLCLFFFFPSVCLLVSRLVHPSGTCHHINIKTQIFQNFM